MGLGAPRKRIKLSHDPNNTTWTRSTTNYGHKMLLSQGWTPGSLLGAVDAPHAHLHSDANASHIRVALKDDNLGLGAKKGSGQAAGECTGLDAFQGLLGRLNGKSEEILEKEQRSRDNLKRALYTERRWGALHFVSGGVLVGDKIQALAEGERARLAGKLKPLSSAGPSKADETMELKSKRQKKSSHHPVPVVGLQAAAQNATVDKEPNENEANIDTPTHETTTSSTPRDEDSERSGADETKPKAQRRAEKRQRKLDRRKRRVAKKAAQSLSTPTMLVSDSQLDDRIQKPPVMEVPSLAPPSAIAVSGRHAVRQRFIRQKQMAVMDPKALNEILMIKA